MKLDEPAVFLNTTGLEVVQLSYRCFCRPATSYCSPPNELLQASNELVSLEPELIG